MGKLEDALSNPEYSTLVRLLTDITLAESRVRELKAELKELRKQERKESKRLKSLGLIPP